MTNRYYDCDPFPGEPLRDRLEVLDSADGKGEGLKARVAFRRGELVFAFHGAILREQSLHTLQLGGGRYISDPLVMGKVLHSCAPNMVCDLAALAFTASRDIRSGEMLTMDYETTEDVLWRAFLCSCGAANCRGFVRGRAVTSVQAGA